MNPIADRSTGPERDLLVRFLAAKWRGAPVRLHGDVSDSNLVVRGGRRSARPCPTTARRVFGEAFGDPAGDA